ncbi:MAG: DUF1972 domain-containing protein [Bacteroidales bacterium]|nr:DUF1972 domain-containing protein [Bacteroidales bacterium]
MKRVAILGTQGVPAKYGGFETLVENIIGDNCSDDIEYTIFCSGKDMPERLPEYKGAKLKYVNFRANGVQSIPYDIVSMMRSMRGYDTIMVLGVSGCIFLPFLKLFSRSKIIVNIDGLEHRRTKWKGWVRRFLKLSESIAVRYADMTIADNRGIQDYVSHVYNKEAQLVTYGGNHALVDVSKERETEILEKYSLKKNEYHMSLCRIEPENNCHLTLEAFSKSNEKLIFIGNWQHNGYSKKLKEQYSGYDNIMLLDSIYDLDILYALRKNTKCYIHGHSAGGTNPSLVEAMFFGRPVLAFNIVYNRETTHHKAKYYQNSKELLRYIENIPDNGNKMSQVAWRYYTWKRVAKEYEALY